MNPLHWKRAHQIALLGAAVFGGCMGIFVGIRQIDPSDSPYWLHVGLWGALGALLAAIGAFVRQLTRDRGVN